MNQACICDGRCGRHTGTCGAVDGTLHVERKYRHNVSERDGLAWCDVCWALQRMGGPVRESTRESTTGQLELVL